MSSAPATHTPAGRTSANINSRRTLQRLRRLAGFSGAKDFTAEVGIPETTYTRYERAPETPQRGIPMANAWAIADRARALTRESRHMLDDYLDYLEHRDAEDAQARR